MQSTKYRYLFMGTPEFAVTVLNHLIETIGAPLLVVSQPDKPVGRKALLTMSPVKAYAVERGLPVLTPDRLSDDETLTSLIDYRADFVVTAAYGKILPLALLASPTHGCLNVHASLLPRYRGASPVSSAILAGDDATGVTIMSMDQGIDTGPLLSRIHVAIAPDDTTETLMHKLALAAGPLLVETIDGVLHGSLSEEPQNNDEATLTRQLKKADGVLDFKRDAAYLERQVRAMQPWPRAYATLATRLIYVLAAEVIEAAEHEALPGTIVALDAGIDVACGQGVLRLLRILPAGKREMAASEMAHNLRVGDAFTIE